MKLYVMSNDPVGAVLAEVAKLSGNCTVIHVLEEADEVLCTNSNDAREMLLMGHQVILVPIGKYDHMAANTYERDERYKNNLTIFRWTFDPSDEENMAAFINHIAQ